MVSSFESIFPKPDLNNFIRNIYPGLIIASFLFWWESSIRTVLGNDQISIALFFLVLVLTSGFLFTGIYRGIFFHLLRWIEMKIGNYPQYNFHRQVIHELCEKKGAEDREKIKLILPKLKEVSFISACTTRIVLEKDDGIFRNELTLINGQVHLVYSSFILTALGSMFSFYYFDNFTVPLICVILTVLLLIGGLKFNYLADMRETLFLIKYKEDYSNLLDRYITFLIR